MSARTRSQVRHLWEDLEELSTRAARLADDTAGSARCAAEAALVSQLEEVSGLLGRATGALEAALGSQDPARRQRARPRLCGLTLYPETIPAVALLGVQHHFRTWWRPSLVGQLVALHGGRHWGGSTRLTAKPAAVDQMVRRGRAAGCTEAQLRAYEAAALGLAEDWRGLVGGVRVVVRVSGAVACDPAAPPSPWMPARTGWVWTFGEVYVLPECIAVPRHGSRRQLWRVPRVLADQVLGLLPEL